MTKKKETFQLKSKIQKRKKIPCGDHGGGAGGATKMKLYHTNKLKMIEIWRKKNKGKLRELLKSYAVKDSTFNRSNPSHVSL